MILKMKMQEKLAALKELISLQIPLEDLESWMTFYRRINDKHDRHFADTVIDAAITIVSPCRSRLVAGEELIEALVADELS